MIRDEVREYAAAMNRGDFFLAHEILEKPWKTEGDPFYRDDGVRALIFVAAAALHAARGNPKGVRSTAAKALERLVPRGPVVHGIEAERLLPLLEAAVACGSLPCLELNFAEGPP